MKILGISGSLRKGSYSSALMHAAALIQVSGIDFIIAKSLDRLPYFNMDIDSENPPDAVREWRREIETANAVLFFTPEYVHNIPGVLKNALDWLVSSHEICQKPVAVISSAPNYMGAEKAHASLSHILDVISGNLMIDACFKFPAVNRMFDNKGNLMDPDTIAKLAKSLSILSNICSKNTQ